MLWRVPAHRPGHVGRTGAERRGPPGRRARARPHGVPRRAVLGPRRHVRRRRAPAFRATLVELDGKRLADGPRLRRRHRRARAPSADVVLLDEAGAAALADRLRDPPFTVASVESEPFTERPQGAVHHVDAAAGGRPQARASARRARWRVAQRLYERGLITYMRTDSHQPVGAGGQRGPHRRSASMYGEEYLPDRAAHVPQQGEERAGGARGDPARRRPHPHARRRARRARRPTSGASTS